MRERVSESERERERERERKREKSARPGRRLGRPGRRRARRPRRTTWQPTPTPTPSRASHLPTSSRCGRRDASICMTIRAGGAHRKTRSPLQGLATQHRTEKDKCPPRLRGPSSRAARRRRRSAETRSPPSQPTSTQEPKWPQHAHLDKTAVSASGQRECNDTAHPSTTPFKDGRPMDAPQMGQTTTTTTNRIANRRYLEVPSTRRRDGFQTIREKEKTIWDNDDVMRRGRHPKPVASH